MKYHHFDTKNHLSIYSPCAEDDEAPAGRAHEVEVERRRQQVGASVTVTYRYLSLCFGTSSRVPFPNITVIYRCEQVGAAADIEPGVACSGNGM
jgi:hypothetical protein